MKKITFIYLFVCFSISSFLKSCESDNPKTPQQSQPHQDDSQTPQQSQPQDDPQTPQQSQSQPQDDSQTPQQPEPSSGKKVELTSNLSSQEIQSFIYELETYKKELLSNEYPSYFYRILDFHNFYTWQNGLLSEENENTFFNRTNSSQPYYSIAKKSSEISKTVTQSLIETLEKEIQITTKETRLQEIEISLINKINWTKDFISKAKKFDRLLSQVNFLNPEELESQILQEYMDSLTDPDLREVRKQNLQAIQTTNTKLTKVVFDSFIDDIILKLDKIDPDPTIINDVEEEITTDIKRLNSSSSEFINTTIKNTIKLIEKLSQQ